MTLSLIFRATAVALITAHVSFAYAADFFEGCRSDYQGVVFVVDHPARQLVDTFEVVTRSHQQNEMSSEAEMLKRFEREYAWRSRNGGQNGSFSLGPALSQTYSREPNGLEITSGKIGHAIFPFGRDRSSDPVLDTRNYREIYFYPGVSDTQLTQMKCDYLESCMATLPKRVGFEEEWIKTFTEKDREFAITKRNEVLATETVRLNERLRRTGCTIQ